MPKYTCKYIIRFNSFKFMQNQILFWYKLNRVNNEKEKLNASCKNITVFVEDYNSFGTYGKKVISYLHGNIENIEKIKNIKSKKSINFFYLDKLNKEKQKVKEKFKKQESSIEKGTIYFKKMQLKKEISKLKEYNNIIKINYKINKQHHINIKLLYPEIVSKIFKKIIYIETGIEKINFEILDSYLNASTEIYAIPGSIFNKKSGIANYIIKNGGIPVTTINDFI